MSKGSGGVKQNYVGMKPLQIQPRVDFGERFHSVNYYVNGMLRGMDISQDEMRQVTSEKEMRDIVNYLDDAFKTMPKENGDVFRGLGFRSRGELFEFLGSNIKGTEQGDSVYTDKGFAFVSPQKLEEAFQGGKYSVELRYKDTEYINFDNMAKGFDDRGVVNRDTPFKITDTKINTDDGGIHYILTLERLKK